MTVTELNPDPPEFDRQPPHDVLAERSVLGACLMSATALDDVIDAGLRGRDFYRPDHEAVWDAVQALRSMNQPTDTITVAAELLQRGHLARAGGPAGLHSLVEAVPTAANATYYARIVRERAVLRRLVHAGTKVVQLGYAQDGGDVGEIVNAAVSEVAAVADTVHQAKDETLDQVADRAMSMIESGGDVVTPTPWSLLNDVIDGSRPGRFIAVGARPAVGKTVFSLQWAIAHARHIRADGQQVAYGTWEMTSERLYQRALASVSGVPVKRIMRGHLTDAELAAVVDADIDLRQLPITFVGASGWSPQQFRAHLRRLHRRQPVGMAVVDHIGLTRPERSGGRSENRQSELSEAADVFLATGHDLACTMLVVTQLNRSATNRSDPRPVPTDIRDTDRIEQNADILALLHRDKDNHPEELWVAVAKNREGDERAVQLKFDGPRSRITEPEWKPYGGAP